MAVTQALALRWLMKPLYSVCGGLPWEFINSDRITKIDLVAASILAGKSGTHKEYCFKLYLYFELSNFSVNKKVMCLQDNMCFKELIINVNISHFICLYVVYKYQSKKRKCFKAFTMNIGCGKTSSCSTSTRSVPYDTELSA